MHPVPRGLNFAPTHATTRDWPSQTFGLRGAGSSVFCLSSRRSPPPALVRGSRASCATYGMRYHLCRHRRHPNSLALSPQSGFAQYGQYFPFISQYTLQRTQLSAHSTLSHLSLVFVAAYYINESFQIWLMRRFVNVRPLVRARRGCCPCLNSAAIAARVAAQVLPVPEG